MLQLVETEVLSCLSYNNFTRPFDLAGHSLVDIFMFSTLFLLSNFALDLLLNEL